MKTYISKTNETTNIRLELNKLKKFKLNYKKVGIDQILMIRASVILDNAVMVAIPFNSSVKKGILTINPNTKKKNALFIVDIFGSRLKR